jgi:hypothetical protein
MSAGPRGGAVPLVLQLIPDICSTIAPVPLTKAGLAGCVEIKPAQQTYILRARKGRFSGLPLLVVAAGEGSFPVSFGWMVHSEEVERVATGASVRGWQYELSQLLP